MYICRHKIKKKDKRAMNTLVSIITVNYNGLADTCEMIDSFRKYETYPYEIIVADNGSRTPEGEEIKKRYPEIKVIQNTNTGFAGGNNAGLKVAQGEYLFFLNNDTLIQKPMLEALVNSLILGVLSWLVSAVIGTLGAVGLSRIHWKSKGALEYISILPLMIPEIILGMVLMAFFYMLNLPFGMLTLLIGHTVFCVPYILMEVKARLAGMDPALEEAARDLGAGPFRAFRDITLPLIMPAVISGSLLAFAMSMDDVVISIFVNGPRLSTLPIKVYTQLKTGVTPEINALCTILLAATLVIFIVYSLITKKKK